MNSPSDARCHTITGHSPECEPPDEVGARGFCVCLPKEPELKCVWCGRLDLDCICEEVSGMDLEDQLDELLSDEVTR